MPNHVTAWNVLRVLKHVQYLHEHFVILIRSWKSCLWRSNLQSCGVSGAWHNLQQSRQFSDQLYVPINGQLHWICLKPAVCWQKILWAHLLNLFSFRGMFFSPSSVWVTFFPLILTEHTLTDLYPTFLTEDVNFRSPLLPMLPLQSFLEDAVRINYFQIQSCQLWNSGTNRSGTNHSGMNGSSL